MKLRFKSLVSEVAAATSAEANVYFSRKRQFETDCFDVHFTMANNATDFVLLDVRSNEAYGMEHVVGSINLPYAEITEDALAGYANDTLFVVYCSGPHCNGAHRAAARLSLLGRPVKEMLGGIEGWRDSGFELQVGSDVRRTGPQ